MGTYTIGQIAERTGFTASSLRFYDKHGLVPPIERTDAGYRVYDDSSVERLRFLARAKTLGCTLDEITDLVALTDADECEPVQRRLHQLVTAKIADARSRADELHAFTTQLEQAARQLDADSVDGPCDEGCACLAQPTADPATVRIELSAKPDEPIACTLAADDLPARRDDWDAALASVRSRADLADGRIRLEFNESVSLDDLARLVAAEQSCCSFFAFALTVDARGVGLEVEAPADAGAVVELLFGDST